ncbi:hypothetical protein K461DRAFT_289316 [Myriangium duriaei CBS 260.36]|uniref:Serine/threonine-protein kinase Tel1 n=1 Tax=Myriangium duriaei CBS 260.36 TaxID=1168546 RepID=A0A9P4J7U0_9PEZI|nr:hypothetical protein K461DRAFT_289316 [Myriangium duriaei CBS 260.36]
MGLTGIDAALERIESSGAKERTQGLSDLKRIIRQSRQSLSQGSVDGVSFQTVFDRLERIIASDNAAYRKSLASSSKTAKSSASSRLSASFNAYRLFVESTVRNFKWKTARGLIDHLTDVFLIENGEPCEPLALDAAKSINEILSYRPHLEHVTSKEWLRLTKFCLSVLPCLGPLAEDQQVSRKAIVSSRQLASSSPQKRTQRSVHANSQPGLNATSQRHLAVEISRTLRLLTSSTNAPIVDLADHILDILLRSLTDAESLSTAEGELFSALRNTISAVRVESVTSLQRLSLPLVRLLNHWWLVVPARSTLMRDDLLAILWLILPYLDAGMKKTPGDSDLKTSTEQLLQSLLRDYDARAVKDQLKLEDLRLVSGNSDKSLETLTFKLKLGNSASLRNWALLTSMTFLMHQTSLNATRLPNDATGASPARKRTRHSTVYSELMGMAHRLDRPSVIFALQLMALYSQQFECSLEGLLQLFDFVIPQLKAEDPNVASWAMISLSSFACQPSATSEKLESYWTSASGLATRATNSASTSRAACHLLRTMDRFALAQHTMMNDLVMSWQSSLDVLGPSVFEDSSVGLIGRALLYCRRNRPSLFEDMARNALVWAFRTWNPGSTNPTTGRSTTSAVVLQDFLDLMASCTQQGPIAVEEILPNDTPELTLWKTCDESKSSLSYLLDLDHSSRPSSDELDARDVRFAKTSGSAENSVGTILTRLLCRHATQMLDEWQARRDQKTATIHDAFLQDTVLLMRICEYTIISAAEVAFVDCLKMEEQYANLSEAIFSCLTSPECSPPKVDAVADILFANLAFRQSELHSPRQRSTAFADPNRQQQLYSVARRLGNLEVNPSASFDNDGDTAMDDLFDIEPNPRSLRSTNGTQASSHDGEAAQASGYDRTACARLYAKLSAALTPRSESGSMALSPFKIELQDMIASEVVAGRNVVLRLHDLGIDLNETLTYFILDVLSETVLKSYSEERSESGMQMVLRFLLQSLDCWIKTKSLDLQGLVLDLYEFFVSAVGGKILSSTSQKLLSDLLIQIWQRDENYGQMEDAPPLSVRTILFELVANGNVSLNLYQGQNIEIIFSFFTTSNHDALFDDLLSNLPVNANSFEGIAVRLYFLRRLGSRWHSLLKKSVYYIFDAAGQVPSSVGLATKAIREITSRHRFEDSRSLFRAFCSQLIHTWMIGHSLNEVPSAVFGFDTLKDLVEDNIGEIVAQCLYFHKTTDLDELKKLLACSELDLVRRSFPYTFAYSIAHDLSHDTGEAKLESRIVDLFPSQTEYIELVREYLPSILTKLLISTSLDPGLQRNLEKKAELRDAAAALASIQNFASDTTAPLPPLQPLFRGKNLFDSFDRTARRAHLKSVEFFRCPMFTACIRGLLDTKIPQLGSLHARNVVHRLRLLCALGESSLASRYPAETMLRALRLLLLDARCADDTIGLTYFVYDRCRQPLSTASAWLAGCALHTLMTVQISAQVENDILTQDSQRQATQSKLQKLKSWLIQYSLELAESSSEKYYSNYQQMVRSCGNIKFPASFDRDTAASECLLLLLDDEISSVDILPQGYRTLLLQLLLKHSVGSAADRNASHVDATRYSAPLWRVSRSLDLSDETAGWLAAVIGRSYSESGSSAAQRLLTESSDTSTQKTSNFAEAINLSMSTIITEVVQLILSDHQLLASAAENGLRAMIQKSASENNLTLVQLLPQHVYEALDLTSVKSAPRLVKSSLDSTERLSSSIDDYDSINAWISSLAENIIKRCGEDPLSSMLRPIIRIDVSFSGTIISPLVHLFLASESSHHDEHRLWLSSTFKSTFANSSAVERSGKLLEVLIYMLNQPMRDEKTRIDRLNWLDVQYLDAIRAAVVCQKPLPALYLLELLPKATPISSSRTSRRSFGKPEFETPEIPQEVLVAIYESIPEPDSFYSVERPSSMESILQKVDREDDTFKSLVLHSACLDASYLSGGHGNDQTHYLRSVGALSQMHLDSLVQRLTSQPRSNRDLEGSSSAMTAAQRLYEWDIGVSNSEPSPRSLLFLAFQGLQNASTSGSVQKELTSSLAVAMRSLAVKKQGGTMSNDGFEALALLSDVRALMDCRNFSSVTALLERFDVLQHNWDAGQQSELVSLRSQRDIIFGILRRNDALQAELKLQPKDALSIEMKSVLKSLSFSHNLTQSRGAPTAAVYLSNMVSTCADLGVYIDARAKLEMATVLWSQKEQEASIKILQGLTSRNDLDEQLVPIGKAGLLAQLGHQVAEARLERSEEIADRYLRPALDSLTENSPKGESAKVYYEFASFCDQQLQDPDTLDDLKRFQNLRDRRVKDKKQIDILYNNATSREAKMEIKKSVKRVEQFYKLDLDDYRKMTVARDGFVHECLKNYLRALSVSDEYDIHVVRFFALWLEHDQSEGANKAVAATLPKVASWKFVTLLNQLMSRLLDHDTPFQSILTELVSRICADHPYHSIYQLFASSNTKVAKNDSSANARKSSATKIADVLRADKRVGRLFNKVWDANLLYQHLASTTVDTTKATKFSLRDIRPAYQMNKRVSELGIPPATIHLELRPAADYDHVPIITRFRDEVSIANGLSCPKVLTARASDGQLYKQLFKGGNDDLRQDAIMEQVFASVSSLLRNHTATRKRNLHIRTYSVVPLSATTGIIEFVANSLPLGDWLINAHHSYHPSDLRWEKARSAIKNSQESPKEQRISTFRSVAKQYHPVLRYFFFERFPQPDDWFSKRLAYARSTAAISILGHVLGLGDRHCSNILLDEHTGEVVHIDLGVAFETGRVLPVPEVVPFRLTRDIVDGLGATGVEGVFRRCSEAVLTALREDKPAIMTLLNVLRYDPLYSWSVSPLRVKRMQTEAAGAEAAGDAVARDDGPAEAERALATVERKLSPILSVQAEINSLIQIATDDKNLAVLFAGWSAYS